MRQGALVLAGCLVLGLLPSNAGSAGRSAIPAIAFEKYRLANGLRVILAEDDRLPLVAINVRYDAGSANDPAGQAGFAHLFEHLFSFAPLKHFGEPPIALLQRAGATQASAVTSPDRTTYFATLPAAKLELALAIEGDRMRHFAEMLDEALFERERVIVRNERRLNVDGKPYGAADEAAFEGLFPPGHPYRHRYIGTHSGIESAGFEQARQFFGQYYGPGNATLSIAGRIDRADVKALIERHLGAIPATAVPSPPKVLTPPLAHETRLTVQDRVDLPRISVAWLAPPAFVTGDPEMRLLPFVLGGATGALHRSLVQERRLAQDVVVEHLPYAAASVFRIDATARPGVKPEELESALDDALQDWLREGAAAGGIDRARRTLELQILRGLERLGDITSPEETARDTPYGGIADQLSQCDRFFGDPGCLPRVLQSYRTATPDTVRNVARSVLGTSHRVIVRTVPDEKPDRSGPKAELPAPQRFTLPNGLTVLLLEQRRLPVLRVNLVVPGGSAISPVSQPGLASFTAELLTRGTRQRSAARLASDAAQLGTTLQTDVGSDGAALGISVLKESLEEAMELLAEAIVRPTFPQEEIDAVREERLAGQAVRRSNPDVLASHLFLEALFPAGSPYRAAGLLNDGLFAPTPPYGCEEVGTEDSLKGIARADLVSFWQRAYRPGRSALIVAGDVSLEELRRLAQIHFGGWTGEAAGAVEPPKPVVPAAPRRQILIADAGPVAQTVLRAGAATGVPPGSPDYAPLRMANVVLGEIYSSRLTKNLRERNGYTYLVRSRFASRREPGQLFAIGTSVRTEATAEAIRELLGEIRRIGEEPVTAEELDLARNTLMGALVGRFEVTSEAAAALGESFLLGLPADHHRALQKSITDVSVADIQRAARAFLPAESMTVVAVGDRSRIEGAVRALNLAEVSTR